MTRAARWGIIVLLAWSTGDLVGANHARAETQIPDKNVTVKVVQGRATFYLDRALRQTAYLEILPRQLESDEVGSFEATFTIDPGTKLTLRRDADGLAGVISSTLPSDGILLARLVEPSGPSPAQSPIAVTRRRPTPDSQAPTLFTRLALSADEAGRWSVSGAVGETPDRMTLFTLPAMLFDLHAEQDLLVAAAEVTVAPELAQRLGAPAADAATAGAVLLELRFTADLARGTQPDSALPPVHDGPTATGPSTQTAAFVGPDVIVGDLHQISNYGQVGGISAFAVGTISCNAGDQPLQWIHDTPEHPVIAQNLYRLKDDRFEQIGQSWVKHGFAAINGNFCAFGCNNPGTTTQLGVGCSDPYSSSLNGTQSILGPKSEINAHTGVFPYPPILNPPALATIGRRLQVFNRDLDPALEGGGLYFIEGHYVAADDAAAGNQDNNASHRRVEPAFNEGNNTWELSLRDTTQRRKPAIRAWKARDPSVVETDVRVPGEGLFILAAKAASTGESWVYHYALANLNSDRSAGSFRVPVDVTRIVSDVSFHDVPYHSDEVLDGLDWSSTVENGAVTWATDPFDVNPNANALRWGTLYSFGFVSELPPQPTTVTIGLFKPGSPDAVQAQTIGPLINAGDCNENGTADSLDVVNGTSQDCNGNWVPDECESFDPEPLKAVRVAAGLASPVYVTTPPSDTARLFIVEQPGRIRILKSGAVLTTPFLDISEQVLSGGERGLLSMAFHPQYADNGFFFVNYTNTSGDTVLARYGVSPSNPDLADPASAALLKLIEQDFSNHNGGQLQFGPDGMLYVGMGDGGNAFDPNNRAQDASTLLGKMLRLDVDRPPDFIPPDNPFAGGGLPLDEIWAFGLRNPWRFSFDRLTGDLYIADVGQSTEEEINFQPASSAGGENYGWRCMEGFTCTGRTGCTCNAPDLTLPILTYPNEGAECAVTGGYAYRGCAMPHLSGAYLYADFCSGFIRSFRYVEGQVTDQQDLTSQLTPPEGPIGAISSFGEDASGELYIVSLDGDVYRILPDVGASVCGNGVIEEGEECEPPDAPACDENCLFRQAPDNCTDAEPIDDGLFEFNTAKATTDGPDETKQCDFGGDTQIHADVWFCYTAPCAGTVQIDLCDSDFDTKVAVYQGCDCPTDPAALACNDDDCGLQSRLSFSADPCATYLIRVGGNDGGSGTVVMDITCTPDPVADDCNGNGIEDAADIACGRSFDRDANGVPDECETAGDFIRGGRIYDRWWAEVGVFPPENDHPLWALRPDPDSNTRTGADTWRCKECHGWDYKGADGQYGTGPHRTGFPGIDATTLSAAELFELLAQPPGNFGGEGVENGHDYGAVLTDEQIEDAVAFVLLGVLNTDALVSPASGDFFGDPLAGQTHYTDGVVRCSGCHGADGTAINFGTFNDPRYLGTVATENPWAFLHKVRFAPAGAPMPSWLSRGGADENVADIGRYIQLNFPTECVFDEQCDDGIDCTVGDCNDLGRCDFLPDDALCADDGVFCNGAEVCQAGTGCVGSGNPCTKPDTCDEVNESCGCFAPVVAGAGGRYLAVTPQPAESTVPMAIRITPDCPESPPRYVAAPDEENGLARLVDDRAQAAFLTPQLWGTTVFVTGLEIVPDTMYRVEADCGASPAAVLSLPAFAETLTFGDVAGQFDGQQWMPPDGLITISDAVATVDAFRGTPLAPPTYRTDLIGCIPDTLTTIGDVVAVIDGFRGRKFEAATLCPVPCTSP